MVMTDRSINYCPYEIHQAFHPEDLAGHFVLAAEPAHVPPTWTQFQLGCRHLACEPRLPCFRLVDKRAQPLGFLLGFPINEAGDLLVDTSREVVVANPAEIEPWLYALAGRWLAILITPDFERVYMDPGGSLCAVYSESAGIVATSSGLIPYSADTGDRTELIAQMPILSQVSMYPIGITPRYGVERLLPNHYLDLSTWRPHRHWPQKPIATNPDTETVTREITALTRRHIAAVAAQYPLQMSMTAGRDSRALLAVSRPLLERAQFFTTSQPTRTAELDVHIAKRIARTHRLDHRVVPFIVPDEIERHLWYHRTGCSIGNPSSAECTRMIKQLDPERAYLPGFLGELSRYVYVNFLSTLVPEWDGRTVTPEHLMALSLAPRTEEAMARMTGWLDSVQLENVDQIINLFYLEQRVGCWVAINTSAFADTYRFELWPFNNRRIVELMLSLPVEFKMANGMHTAIMDQEWPELLDIPLNKTPLRMRIRRKATRYLKALSQ